MTKRTVNVSIAGHKLKLSNLEKVLFPTSGFTKADMINYYVQIAPYMIQHLRDRYLTLKRFPEGVSNDFFYQKQCPSHRPAWVRVAETGLDSPAYCVITDTASLIWVANLASIELHTLLSRIDDPKTPSMMVFDLDPGEPADILDCAKVAIDLIDILADQGHKSFVKTSGKKGLHLYVPLNTKASFEQTKKYSRALAETYENSYPKKATSTMSKAARPGKVYIDWAQNDASKTTVCVYSLRAIDPPTVSAPIPRDLLEQSVIEQNPELLVFSPKRMLDSIENCVDLFAEVLTLRQSLKI